MARQIVTQCCPYSACFLHGLVIVFRCGWSDAAVVWRVTAVAVAPVAGTVHRSGWATAESSIDVRGQG